MMSCTSVTCTGVSFCQNNVMLRNNLSNIINIFSPGFVLDVSFKKNSGKKFSYFFYTLLA